MVKSVPNVRDGGLIVRTNILGAFWLMNAKALKNIRCFANQKNQMKGVFMMNRFSQDHGVWGNIVTSYFPTTRNRSWHYLMVTFISMLMFVSFTILSGCSGGGGGTTTTPTTTPTTDTPTVDDPVVDDTGYTGSAKVSGTIKLSYLSSSDSTQIESTDTVGRAVPIRSKISKAVDTETEAVKLYVVGEDGELEDTGISCTFEEDGEDRTYDCDGVKDGINYIVRYVKLNATTGKALEMKASAYVPEGGTAPAGVVDVSPQTSVVVKALVDAILSATAGTGIDDEIVNTIIQSVKTAIETLVSSGFIQIPSMVVDVDDGTTLDDLVGDDTENEKLDNTAGLILTDSTVDAELGIIASYTQAASFDLSTVDTPEEKAALIQKVFNDLLTDETGDKEGMPDFFYNFFTWHYVEGMTVTAGDLLGTLIGSMTYYCGDNQSCTDPASVYYADTIAQITVTNALTLINAEMNELYAALTLINSLAGTAVEDLTDQQKANLALAKAQVAQFPPVIRGLFPSTMPDLTPTTELVTPQGIALIIFFEKVFMSSGTYLGDAASDDDWWEWDDGDLFVSLGMETYVTTHSDEFQGIEIFGLYLHPGTIWIEGNAANNYMGYEMESLMGGTDLMDLSQFALGGEPDITEGVDVTLTYPKATGGTGEIAMLYITHDGEPYGYWGIDPWSESQMTPYNGDQQAYFADNPDRIASDFTSGNYTITVYEPGTTNVLATKTFTKTVITGMLDTYAKLLTPAGEPVYPGDDATSEEMNAYNAAWDLFYNNVGHTTFAATLNSDGVAVDTGATHAKITVSWKAPVIDDLPDGVKMFYDIQIGFNDCDEFGGNCMWNDIWNTWQVDKRVYTTSFTIPELLPKIDRSANPYDAYNIHVGVNFVDLETGEYLGRGGSAYTQFYVGEPIDKTATFEIAGNVSIDANALSSDGVTPVKASDLRIALIKESMVDNTFTQTVIKISDITSTGDGKASYSLSPTIGDFLDNAGMNTWFNLIMIEDPDDTLSADDPLGNTVMMYWPDFSSGGLWFDTWGGILRVNKDTCTADGTCFSEEKIISGGEEVTGPKFYIGGGYYVQPDPTSITAVSAENLATDFTITGNVDTTNVTNAVVVMIKGGYNDSVGYWTESVLAIGEIISGTYTVTLSVGDFYDADGYPIDAYFDLVLIDDETTDGGPVAAGGSIDYMNDMVYWPDYSTMSFWFDTWRGDDNLHVIKETYDDVNFTWTREEWDVPTTYTTVQGPDLAVPIY